jgi:hypothetical protein
MPGSHLDSALHGLQTELETWAWQMFFATRPE